MQGLTQQSVEFIVRDDEIVAWKTAPGPILCYREVRRLTG